MMHASRIMYNVENFAAELWIGNSIKIIAEAKKKCKILKIL